MTHSISMAFRSPSMADAPIILLVLMLMCIAGYYWEVIYEWLTCLCIYFGIGSFVYFSTRISLAISPNEDSETAPYHSTTATDTDDIIHEISVEERDATEQNEAFLQEISNLKKSLEAEKESSVTERRKLKADEININMTVLRLQSTIKKLEKDLVLAKNPPLSYTQYAKETSLQFKVDSLTKEITASRKKFEDLATEAKLSKKNAENLQSKLEILDVGDWDKLAAALGPEARKCIDSKFREGIEMHIQTYELNSRFATDAFIQEQVKLYSEVVQTKLSSDFAKASETLEASHDKLEAEKEQLLEELANLKIQAEADSMEKAEAIIVLQSKNKKLGTISKGLRAQLVSSQDTAKKQQEAALAYKKEIDVDRKAATDYLGKLRQQLKIAQETKVASTTASASNPEDIIPELNDARETGLKQTIGINEKTTLIQQQTVQIEEQFNQIQELVDYKNQLALITAENSNLKLKEQASTQIISKLETDVEKLQSSAKQADCSEKLVAYEEKLKAITSEKAKLLEEIKTSAQSFDNLRNELVTVQERTKQELAAKDDSLCEGLKAYQQLQSDIASKHSIVEDLQRRLENGEQMYLKSQESLQAAQQDISNLQAEKQVTENAVCSSCTALKHKLHGVNEVSKQLAMVTAQLEFVNGNFSTCKNQLTRKMAEIGKLVQQIDDKDAALQNLQHQLNTTMEVVGERDAHLSTAATQLSRMNQKLTSTIEELNDLRAKHGHCKPAGSSEAEIALGVYQAIEDRIRDAWPSDLHWRHDLYESFLALDNDRQNFMGRAEALDAIKDELVDKGHFENFNFSEDELVAEVTKVIDAYSELHMDNLNLMDSRDALKQLLADKMADGDAPAGHRIAELIEMIAELESEKSAADCKLAALEKALRDKGMKVAARQMIKPKGRLGGVQAASGAAPPSVPQAGLLSNPTPATSFSSAFNFTQANPPPATGIFLSAPTAEQSQLPQQQMEE